MKLIIPVAGKSSRFPNLKPKWLLVHPNGNLMIVEAISKIEIAIFDEIILISTKDIEDQYHFSKVVKEQITHLLNFTNIQCVLLDKDTLSQSETVAEGMKVVGGDFEFFVKDSDNQFHISPDKGNYVCIDDLNTVGLIDPSNKSYVEENQDNILINIVEKQVISSKFCVGGYSFKSSEEFINYYENNKKYSGEMYISSIIYNMILDNVMFTTKMVDNYKDWGTVDDWNRYKSEYATLFIDIDGVLVKHSEQYFSPKWGETDAILENIEIINKLYRSNTVDIVLITSRNEGFRSKTEAQLKRLGIMYNRVIYGLLGAKRIIINSYSLTNPYKSCDSINLKCDSSELGEILKEMMAL